MVESTYRDRNSTADRALDILLMFDEERTSITASEVAKQLDVARSTAYRYVQSLAGSGFIEESPGGGFQLGPRILELARLVRRGNGLTSAARPVMRQLARDVRETVLLTRLAGSAVICLERADAGERAVRISYEVGQVLPTNAGASARVLLAWLEPSALDAVLAVTTFTKFTEETIVDERSFRERLAHTRAQGVAISRGELDNDVLGVAAPIFGEGHQILAGVSVAALSSRVPDDRIEWLSRAVRTAAEEITARLQLLAT